MRSMLFLCALALTLAACGEDTPVDNRPRFVEQDRLDNPVVPLEHVDTTVHTEAISAMRIIADRIKIKALTATDSPPLAPHGRWLRRWTRTSTNSTSGWPPWPS